MGFLPYILLDRRSERWQDKHMTTNPYHNQLLADEAAAWLLLLEMRRDNSIPSSEIEKQRKAWVEIVKACEDNGLEVEDA